MKKEVSVREAKTRLSQLLRRVARGEEIVIANRGVPVARLVPVARAKAHRELGIESVGLKVADDFDAPLPADILAAFHGQIRGSERRERR
jgi:prevent-host-death family protein